MFTGIIENMSEIIDIKTEGTNRHFCFRSNITNELKVDQSVAHNGVCLTITQITNDTYFVTAIEETLMKTHLATLNVGDKVNIERCMLMNGRFDGHIVQGHVDCTASCVKIEDKNGSIELSFKLPDSSNHALMVNKGSICINGVSLTIVECHADAFKVAIIPYTASHTNLGKLKVGDSVNIEFDIIGKYLQKQIQAKH